ncbi:hypothetical protein [Amycolatopsis thermophila]|uniref:Uncharacterized protein n=1 Tax=Amycolatopsis thermophila TaxID=206084 RepID=A0ABU0EYG6_9PSEU|nr:hypothetical protein [Amycolatopsis thermophila]MDQ0380354.1 hypothetical protein [Amycolatopsis thermophila]
MGKYEEYREQLFAEFLRLAGVIEDCAKILLQQTPAPVIEGVGTQTEEYVRQLSIDAAKKKEVVWEAYELLGQVHGYQAGAAEAADRARAQLPSVGVTVDDVDGDFKSVREALEDWAGSGALAVKGALNDLETFVGNQSAYVAYLDKVLEQYALLVRTGEDNAEKLAENITKALTDAAKHRTAAKQEFALTMFYGTAGLIEAVKKAELVNGIKNMEQVVGAIQKLQKTWEETDPDKIMTQFRADVLQARTNLAEAGDRLAGYFTAMLENMAKENAHSFFKDPAVGIDVTSPNFKPAQFRLKEATNWDEFARAVEKLPKDTPAPTRGPIAQRLDAAG